MMATGPRTDEGFRAVRTDGGFDGTGPSERRKRVDIRRFASLRLRRSRSETPDGGHAGKRPLPLRILRGLAGFAAAVTVASLLGNAATTPDERLEPESGKTVRVGDANVHYETWGTSGSPVVLLPGFAETTVAFSTTAPRLAAKGHVVYALDLSSVGYTRGGRPADLADQTRLVHDWAAKLGIEKPIVVGHSMGAAVAGNLGLVYPDSVGGVIFAGGDALNMDFGDGLPQWLATSTWMRSFYRIATRWTWIDQRFLAKSCGSDCTAFDGKAGAELTRKWMRPLTEGRTEEEMTRLIHDPWILHLTTAQIRSIKVPKGIIWGEEDSAEGLRNSRTNLGNPPERIIRGAGHQMMMAAPERFAASVHELSAAMCR